VVLEGYSNDMNFAPFVTGMTAKLSNVKRVSQSENRKRELVERLLILPHGDSRKVQNKLTYISEANFGIKLYVV
jgi:hypothetical protein